MSLELPGREGCLVRKMVKGRIRMPRTRAEFEEILENAFLSGCNWGYGVDHGHNLIEQEQLGVDQFLGRISLESAHEKLLMIWNNEEVTE